MLNVVSYPRHILSLIRLRRKRGKFTQSRLLTIVNRAANLIVTVRLAALMD